MQNEEEYAGGNGMSFFPPIPIIRKMAITKALKKHHAYTEDTAKYLDEIGLINPFGFPMITKRLVEREIINMTKDGKYYIGKRG